MSKRHHILTLRYSETLSQVSILKMIMKFDIVAIYYLVHLLSISLCLQVTTSYVIIFTYLGSTVIRKRSYYLV